jgi:hypothetical protein
MDCTNNRSLGCLLSFHRSIRDGALQTPLPNKFRLFFLCECGEHTESTTNEISYYTHFTSHDGYEVAHLDEFFRQYGSYVVATLKVFKARISEAGFIVPALAYCARKFACSAFADSDFKPIMSPQVLDRMERIMDQIICHVEKPSLKEDKASSGLVKQTGNNETMADIDLSCLGLFLTDNRGKVLGDLYRTVNAKGHVKWICIDHYHEMYQMKATTAFRDTVESLGGSFDRNLGHVKVTLRSRDQADQFHLALEEAKAVYDLNLSIAWNPTHGDLKRLRNVLTKTNVGVITLNLDYWTVQDSDSSDNAGLYDPIFDTMRHSSIKSVTLAGHPQDFTKKSKLVSRNEDFPNLKHLGLDLTMLGSEIPGLRNLVAKAPNLTHLVLTCDFGEFLSVYNAIAEYQTYPITFKDQRLCVLPDKRLTTNARYPGHGRFVEDAWREN